MPKMKNKMEGSNKLFMNGPFETILGISIYKVKSNI